MHQVIEVVATKRSAHHAFIAWIAENSERSFVCLNNVTPSVPPQFAKHHPIYKENKPFPSRGVEDLLSGNLDAIINFEGKFIENIDSWNKEFFGPRLSVGFKKIIFLRDPVNFVASLAKYTARKPKRFYRFFQQILAFESIIAGIKTGTTEYDHLVLMSLWYQDESYRASLGRLLGLKTLELPSQVTAHGGGSSFDGISFDLAAGSAALFRRWKQVKAEPLYLAPFADDESFATIEWYFRRFGEEEEVGMETVRQLRERALRDVQAGRYATRYLRPMRKARSLVMKQESSAYALQRRAWELALRGRVLVGI